MCQPTDLMDYDAAIWVPLWQDEFSVNFGVKVIRSAGTMGGTVSYVVNPNPQVVFTPPNGEDCPGDFPDWHVPPLPAGRAISSQ